MVIIETKIFTRQVSELLTDEEYAALQTTLVINPASGPLIIGSGGLRKIRWRARERGKRGGTRIIYYWAARHEQLLMLLIYPKNEQDDLSSDQLKILRAIVESEYP
jgi:hypothetical protein